MRKSVPLATFLRGLAIAVVSLVVLYPLSFGPALVLATRFYTQRVGEAVHTIYTPLITIITNTPLATPLWDYAEFWMRVTGTNAEP